MFGKQAYGLACLGPFKHPKIPQTTLKSPQNQSQIKQLKNMVKSYPKPYLNFLSHKSNSWKIWLNIIWFIIYIHYRKNNKLFLHS